MIRRNRIFFNAAVVALALFSLHCQKTPQESGKADKARFIYNNDGTYILGNSLHGGRPLTVEDVKDYVDIVAGTPVTTYAVCSNSLMPYYESRYERSMGILKEGQQDTGETAHAENVSVYGEGILRLREEGTDIVEICLSRAREQGMEAFITMRMNDLHFNDVTVRNPLQQSDFWLEHPEFRVGEYPGWHADGALNFAHSEVREYKLNTIREMCATFDMDGLELDFMRFPVYFPYGRGREYRETMTSFVAEARQITAKAADRLGHPVLLTVRIPPDNELCGELGFNVRGWVDGGLVDFITLSAFFRDDPLLPVREFLDSIGSLDIPVYGSIDNGIHNPREPCSHGMFRAAAAHMYAEGVDGLYLFNYFFPAADLIEKQRAVPDEGESVCFAPDPALLHDMQSPESLAGRNKLYSLGDNRINEYELKHKSQVPLTLQQDRETGLQIFLHEDFSSHAPESAFLFLTVAKGAVVRTAFNGSVLEILPGGGTAKIFRRNATVTQNEEIRTYPVPVELLRQGENNCSVTLTGTQSSELIHVQLAVGYGDTEEYGYY